MGEAVVCKSNSLIQAGYKLTINEQRIILSCIALLDSREQVTDESLYRVSVGDIADALGVDRRNMYKDIKSATARLMDRKVKLSHDPSGRPFKDKMMVTRWIQSVFYQDTSATVSLRFSKDILPYLTQLTTQFTKYGLYNIYRMKSMYSVRMYELAAQYRKVGQREIELEWLRDVLHIDPGAYGRPNDLKRYVIEPAMRDINDVSDMWVKSEYKKTGRKTTHLLLTFGDKKKKSKRPTPVSTPTIQRKTKPRLVDELVDQHIAKFNTKSH